jgi:hypothetical protein
MHKRVRRDLNLSGRNSRLNRSRTSDRGRGGREVQANYQRSWQCRNYKLWLENEPNSCRLVSFFHRSKDGQNGVGPRCADPDRPSHALRPRSRPTSAALSSASAGRSARTNETPRSASWAAAVADRPRLPALSLRARMTGSETCRWCCCLERRVARRQFRCWRPVDRAAKSSRWSPDEPNIQLSSVHSPSSPPF